MNLHEVLIGVLSGSVLVVFGLVPGLFEGLSEGVRNFNDSVSFGSPMRPRRYTEHYHRRHVWLAGLGAALIALSVLAYFSD